MSSHSCFRSSSGNCRTFDPCRIRVLSKQITKEKVSANAFCEEFRSCWHFHRCGRVHLLRILVDRVFSKLTIKCCCYIDLFFILLVIGLVASFLSLGNNLFNPLLLDGSYDSRERKIDNFFPCPNRNKREKINFFFRTLLFS